MAVVAAGLLSGLGGRLRSRLIATGFVLRLAVTFVVVGHHIFLYQSLGTKKGTKKGTKRYLRMHLRTEYRRAASFLT